MRASDIMTSPVITVAPETPVPEIAALLLERRISGGAWWLRLPGVRRVEDHRLPVQDLQWMF